MLRILVPTVALLFGATYVQPAAAQSGVDLVKQSVAAQGGAAALGAAKTTIIKGEAKHWEPGQSYAATGEAKFLGDSTYTQTVDNATRTVRVDWDRDMKYPAVERLKFSEITTPTFGVVIDDKGEQKRDVGHPPRVDPARAQPRFAAAAGAGAGRSAEHLGDAGSEGRRAHVAGGLDQERQHDLHRAVRSHDQAAGGDPHPRRRFRLRRLELRPDPVGLESGRRHQAGAHAVVPAQRHGGAAGDLEGDHGRCADRGQHLRGQRYVQAGCSRGGDQDAPYQWVLRRMFLGRFLDSDKVYYPGGRRLPARLSWRPTCSRCVGGGANNLIVAMKDGLVIFDAPVDEGQSRWVIDAAKAKYPGKPIKQLVLTHHHMDHTGGTRAYAAEGAAIVIPAQARPFFEKMLAAQHTHGAGRAGTSSRSRRTSWT